MGWLLLLRDFGNWFLLTQYLGWFLSSLRLSDLLWHLFGDRTSYLLSLYFFIYIDSLWFYLSRFLNFTFSLNRPNSLLIIFSYLLNRFILKCYLLGIDNSLLLNWLNIWTRSTNLLLIYLLLLWIRILLIVLLIFLDGLSFNRSSVLVNISIWLDSFIWGWLLIFILVSKTHFQLRSQSLQIWNT